MGHPKQCPGCGRFGTPKLDGYCKDCYPNKHFVDRNVFLDSLFEIQQISEKTVLGALAEVGAKSADKVKAEDRARVLNICERRLPGTGRRHLVQDDSVFGEDEFKYRKHSEFEKPDYGVEGGGYGVEHG